MAFPAPSARTSVQLSRYIIVGGFAFLVDFASLYAITEFLHQPYLVSAAIAFMLGFSVNYLISIVWVFDRRTLKNRWAEATVYLAVGIVGLGLNELLIWFLTETAGYHYLVSKVGSTVIVFLWNFCARKTLLFR